jgi:hypothetical protein
MRIAISCLLRLMFAYYDEAKIDIELTDCWNTMSVQLWGRSV